MSGKAAEQDHSIEEILASIRQIISDDTPAEGGTVPASAPEPTPQPISAAPAATPSSQDAVDDVFELVDRVVAEEESFAPAPEPEPVLPPVAAPPITPPITAPVIETASAPAAAAVEDVAVPRFSAPTAPMAEGDAQVFGDAAASATLGAFAKLSETILLERQRALLSAVTLEDIVRELLTPLLRQWIDTHVPGMVERLVREELEKLARHAREG